MAKHTERLQDLRSRLVESRRNLVDQMTKHPGDASGLWTHFQMIDTMMQAVDRAIEDEDNMESNGS